MTDMKPWWLGGEEVCDYCDGGYAYEIEIRCVDCDGPSCPHCVAIVKQHGPLCHGCCDAEPANEAGF